MPRYVSYRCPDCQGVFRWLHHPSDAPPPDRCQLCGAWVSDDEPPTEVFVPAAPGIRKSAYARSVDQIYRQMEAASTERADEAVGILQTAYATQPHDEEFSGLVKVSQDEQLAALRSELKITDMKDPSQMREGDNAVVGSAAAAAANLSVGASRPGFQMSPGPLGNGVNASAALPGLTGHTGWTNGTAPVANQVHNARAAQMVAAGTMGTYRPDK